MGEGLLGRNDNAGHEHGEGDPPAVYVAYPF